MSFENIRDEYFIDPQKAGQPVLDNLVSKSINIMSEIYAHQGNIDLMSPDIKSMLYRPSSLQGLEELMAEVLRNEAGTRRFDHRFMGQIHPQGNIIGILGNLIGAYMNTNTVIKEVSSAENIMEGEALNWLAEIFNYDTEKFSGNFTTGGTTANLDALWIARNKKQVEMGVDVRKKDWFVIGTKKAHYSMDKACDILGMTFIKTDEVDHKTDVNNVVKAIEDIKKDNEENEIVAILGLAGETETGLIDDLDGLADVAREYGIFYHVDASYCGPFILSRSAKYFKGIERADSITVDPHKMLYVPYNAGAVLFKNKDDQRLVSSIMINNARYLPENNKEGGNDRNYGTTRIEGSMGPSGVISTWLTINLLGKEGIAALLNHTLDLTEYAYDRILNSKNFRPLFKPETNTMQIGLAEDLRSGLGNKECNDVMKEIKEATDSEGYYISENDEMDEGTCSLRFVAMHPYTTTENVEELIGHLEKKASALFP